MSETDRERVRAKHDATIRKEQARRDAELVRGVIQHLSNLRPANSKPKAFGIGIIEGLKLATEVLTPLADQIEALGESE